MKRVGLHIRLHESLLDVAQRVVQLQMPFFQCFLVLPDSNKLLTMSDGQKQAFVAFRRQYFEKLYVHGSYWINLSAINKQGKRALERELALAKELEFTHMILHPGFAQTHDKQEGIDILARMLDKLLRDTDITIVLENTAHGNRSIGSDINDFALLLQKINYPEKLLFCIDTAHAFVYGYDFLLPETCNAFIAYLDATIGLSRLALIHLNDTQKACGSRIDKHECIGDGIIGEDVLKQFMMHPQLAHVPVILEPPKLTEEQERELVQKIKGW